MWTGVLVKLSVAWSTTLPSGCSAAVAMSKRL
jgi:hypothetical protein